MIKVYFMTDVTHNEWVNDCEWHNEEIPQEIYWSEIDFETREEYDEWYSNLDELQTECGLTIKKVEFC